MTSPTRSGWGWAKAEGGKVSFLSLGQVVMWYEYHRPSCVLVVVGLSVMS